MKLKQILQAGVFAPELASDTKDDVLREIVQRLSDAGKLSNARSALAAVLERESKMSTGMQQGVALPHGKSEDVEGLVTAVALKKSGVDFDSLDGEPARIFVLTVSAVDVADEHIRYLAAISRELEQRALRDRLLASGTPAQMLEALGA